MIPHVEAIKNTDTDDGNDHDEDIEEGLESHPQLTLHVK